MILDPGETYYVFVEGIGMKVLYARHKDNKAIFEIKEPIIIGRIFLFVRHEVQEILSEHKGKVLFPEDTLRLSFGDFDVVS